MLLALGTQDQEYQHRGSQRTILIVQEGETERIQTPEIFSSSQNFGYSLPFHSSAGQALSNTGYHFI